MEYGVKACKGNFAYFPLVSLFCGWVGKGTGVKWWDNCVQDIIMSIVKEKLRPQRLRPFGTRLYLS